MLAGYRNLNWLCDICLMGHKEKLPYKPNWSESVHQGNEAICRQWQWEMTTNKRRSAIEQGHCLINTLVLHYQHTHTVTTAMYRTIGEIKWINIKQSSPQSNFFWFSTNCLPDDNVDNCVCGCKSLNNLRQIQIIFQTPWDEKPKITATNISKYTINHRHCDL